MTFNHLMKIFLIFVSLPVNATLIDNGNFTTDTSAGLDWLDLTYTTSNSYNDLILLTSPGGQFEEYELATVSQVGSLLNSAGLPPIGNTTTDFLSINRLIALIGATSNQGSYLESLGITGTPGSDGRGHKVVFIDFYYHNSIPTYVLGGSGSYGNATSFSSVGGWLVRESASIPSPSTIILIIMPLAFFYFRKGNPPEK